MNNARLIEGSVIGVVSLNDITKALESKIPLERDEIIKSLPDEVRDFIDLFLDDYPSISNTLPPNRPGIDTKLILTKDGNGEEKKIPWGPLFNLS